MIDVNHTNPSRRDPLAVLDWLPLFWLDLKANWSYLDLNASRMKSRVPAKYDQQPSQDPSLSTLDALVPALRGVVAAQTTNTPVTVASCHLSIGRIEKKCEASLTHAQTFCV
mmetsp:Transcript_27173/g.74927  ORF Transcript_27173/g.74927 Transcript_27173/m.74927 type:complete len:112 (-) Transcript_27173:48-383(-)